MERISTPTRVVDKHGPGRDGFGDGNPVAGTPSTQLEAAWYDSTQEEIANAIELSGLQLDPDDMEQLYEAINRIATGIAGAYLPLVGGILARPDLAPDPVLTIDATAAFPSLLIESLIGADAVLHCSNGTKILAFGVNGLNELYISDHSGGVNIPLIYFRETDISIQRATVVNGNFNVTGSYGQVSASLVYPNNDNSGSCGALGIAWNTMTAYVFTTATAAVQAERRIASADLPALLPVVTATALQSWYDDQNQMHWGFSPADVSAAMSNAGIDFAGVAPAPSSGLAGLAYNQLTTVLWKAVQELARRLEAIEEIRHA